MQVLSILSRAKFLLLSIMVAKLELYSGTCISHENDESNTDANSLPTGMISKLDLMHWSLWLSKYDLILMVLACMKSSWKIVLKNAKKTRPVCTWLDAMAKNHPRQAIRLYIHILLSSSLPFSLWYIHIIMTIWPIHHSMYSTHNIAGRVNRKGWKPNLHSEHHIVRLYRSCSLTRLLLLLSNMTRYRG